MCEEFIVRKVQSKSNKAIWTCMCGHKHLFVNIQEIEDGHVSFGDLKKIPIKSRKKGLLETGYSFMRDKMLYLKDKGSRMVAGLEMTKKWHVQTLFKDKDPLL